MSIAVTSQRLSQISGKFHDYPAQSLDWPSEIQPGLDWFTSPELMSLYGSEVWQNSTEQELKKLSFYEALNFYSLNINGEKPLVEGLNRRLYAKGYEPLLPYLHHFLDEENKHMQYFGRFCMQYFGRTYPDKKVLFPKEYVPGEEDFLFFVKVVIFEEIADAHNSRQAQDTRLHPLAKKINLLHHQDEARHLIFGRELVSELWETYSPQWSSETRQAIELYLRHYLSATWKEYYLPEFVKDAGFDSAFLLMQKAYLLPEQQTRRQQLSESCLQFLCKLQILSEVPKL